MSEAKHTFGPWEVNTAGATKNGIFVYDEIYVYAPDCGVDDIAIAADIADPLTGQPSIANARLIACAPDLLAALTEYIAAADNSMTADDDIAAMIRFGDANKAARAAIAKATGAA